ncbi:MAG TPA: magnesium transporter [Tepidisphaeraceae bacterium]|nr:magnesium transporter [Tepidisphaeraceae bacterium]
MNDKQSEISEASDPQTDRDESQVDSHEPDVVAGRIEDIPAADGADVLEEMSPAKAADVAEYLDPDTAGRILSEMDPMLAAGVLTDMEPPEASMVVSAMRPDDAVDVLEHLPARVHDAIVDEMEPEEAAEVRQLEKYPPDTAGGIMSPEVTALAENLTVQEAVEELRRLSEELEQMFYVYVVDQRRHLVGVLSMRDLILARPERRLSQIMRSEVASVPVTMDQEQVARIMQRNNYLAMPVVDERHRLIGIVTADDVADVIQEEATEDLQKMFGAGAEERLLSPWTFSFRKRIWWLEVNLATAFLAAWVISRFDTVIALLPILAAWQSIVSGMGGNAGAQALAVAIRGIAMGESAPRLIGRVLHREFLVGLLEGTAIGLTCWLCAAAGIFGYHSHPFFIGLIVFLALLFNHINACVTGVLIPFAMKRFGFDPAQSSTIFATTFTDCGGFFATLWLAEQFMRWLK